MFDYIKDAGLVPARPYSVRAMTDLILIHHVEGIMTVQAIHAMHIAKGNRGIDYNIYIDLDGTVWWGRGLEYEGGSVSNSYYKTKGMNARAVAIVCNGNFNKQQMPEAQKAALKRVVADLVRHYHIASVTQILSHREAAGYDYTDCPGTYFPMEEVREYIRNGGNTPVPPKDTAKPVIGGFEVRPVGNGVVDFIATGVTDDVGVIRVQFRFYPVELGGDYVKTIEAVQNENNSARWAKRTNVAKMFDGRRGKYVVRVRAFDAAGNCADGSGFKYFNI